MKTILEIIEDFKGECPCGREHETTVKDVVIESGAVHRVGEILRKNNFTDKILLVADKTHLLPQKEL